MDESYITEMFEAAVALIFLVRIKILLKQTEMRIVNTWKVGNIFNQVECFSLSPESKSNRSKSTMKKHVKFIFPVTKFQTLINSQ